MADIRTSGTSALAFQSTTFDVVARDGKPWLRANQIGLALEYKNPELSIAKLYRANKAEFTDRMTAVVKLDTAGGAQDTRIFSLRGAHLLAMFARTAKAAEFRRWVLDVLDREVEQQATAKTDALMQLHQALDSAARIGAQVQAEVFGQFMSDAEFDMGRWLLSFHHDAAAERYMPRIKRIDSGAFVCTVRRLADNMSDPASMHKTEDLAYLAKACLAELERRAQLRLPQQKRLV